MSQVRTLIWLKWTLFRNSLRTSRGVVNRVASAIVTIAALIMALLVAITLGVGAYAISIPEGILIKEAQAATTEAGLNLSVEFIFFAVFSFLYLIWATLPLSLGSSRQFEPGRLLIYPISLRKLFAVDVVSEVTQLQSIFALPTVLAVGVGAGLGRGELVKALFATVLAASLGLALSKWLSAAVGSLVRRKQTRGETLLALIGVIAGFGAVLVSQLVPLVLEHSESFKVLRWTPPGAVAFALTEGLTSYHEVGYLLAVTALAGYTITFFLATYWIARRSFTGSTGRRVGSGASQSIKDYTGWETPLLSPELSAILEKEIRYISRNAQLRMMALMPLILIVVRLMNRTGTTSARELPAGARSFFSEFLIYGEGLLATGGIMYVFLLLSGLSCNQFAFEEGGMRTLILSPIDRRKILIGKNIAMTTIALIFSVVLLLINQLVFGDLTSGTILFVSLSFIIFAGIMSLVGNSLSMRFPKRMPFGKNMNVSGMVGLMLIPLILVLALPPLIATAVGYLTRSLLIEYVTLALFAVLVVGFYALIINAQGRMLQRREVEILEAVREPES